MPSLMQLPQELHLAIIRNLKPFPDAPLLRLVNRYFYALIRPLSDEEMRRLQHKRCCVKRNLRYCVDCRRFRPDYNFVPRDPSFVYVEEGRNLYIECGMHSEGYCYPRGSLFKSQWRTRVMCEDCSDMPKDSLRRHEDLCRECWGEMERLHGTDFPLWKEGLGEEEVLRHQVKLFRGTARLHHQANCRRCWRGFQGCEWLMRVMVERN